ncbi:hypothetical protein J31TS6_57420 [Brevibacillus reuszeri]|uniref:hypothetical protein n=1 Tax=Brevibacillus reuszeri TaxID=54915 RepID=UPI001B158DE1|nr:hypothetical protein [Brevibacillus reuszeri]GIO09714.1 hypothetical protein J31TS6_57420 [Brevibacillus reuszeri]
MFRIKIIKDLRTGSGWIRTGEEMEARVLPGGLPFEAGRPYQVISGTYSGQEIPQSYAVTIPKEKLFTEQQYTAISTELLKTTTEKQLLQQEINDLVEEKKVSLPHHVAIAIQICRDAGMSRIDIVTTMEHVSQLFRDYDKPVLEALTVIRDFARKTIGGGQDLLEALVNGYTIKESPQERIKRGVQEIYEKWTTIPTSGDDREDGEDLADLISAFVTEELKL